MSEVPTKVRSMHILLSNDDGVHAEGLRRLRDGLRRALPGVKITTVAPASEQSASSHALTLSVPLRITKVDDGCYSVTGTPTDCVLIAVRSLLRDDPPTVVLSGMNHGPNMGEDVHYSGTVAAAMEGLIVGLPSVAISVAERKPPIDFGAADRFVAEVLPRWFEVGWGKTLLNVNIPARPAERVEGMRFCRLGSREYHDVIVRKQDPRGRDYYWVGGHDVTFSQEGDTDFVLSGQGYITVTPLQVDITDQRRLAQLKSLERTWQL